MLLPEKPRDTTTNEISQDTKQTGGRRRGKSFTQATGFKPDRPRSPEVKRGKKRHQLV